MYKATDRERLLNRIIGFMRLHPWKGCPRISLSISSAALLEYSV